jgi:hypothetical protein
MPSNINYEIIVSQINTLYEAMRKEMNMEGYMLECNANLEIILGKVQRWMTSLIISSQVPCTSREIEE